MRAVAISILTALALAACGPAPTAPAPEEAPPPAAEAPVEQPPPPTAEPAPPEEQAAEEEVQMAPPPPPPEARPPIPLPRDIVPMEEKAPSSIDRSDQATTRSLAPPKRTVARSMVIATPVIVEIDRTQDRRAANGGSAVVLFSDASSARYRNTVTCVNVWNLMDTATTQEVRVGVRKAEDGTIEALRPLYWMNQTPAPGGEQTCSQRMARYDYARARTIRDKYGLSGNGPYFVVARTDEKAAAVIDLTGRTDREIADLVRYFRDGFAFQNDIWDPARNEPAKKRALLTTFFGSRFRESMLASLGFVSNPAPRAGCTLGDLRDAPCT